MTKAAEQQLTTWPQYDYCYIVQPLVDADWKATFIYNPQVLSDSAAGQVMATFLGNLDRLATRAWSNQ